MHLLVVDYRKSYWIPLGCDNLFDVKNIKNIKLSFHSGKMSNYTASGKALGKEKNTLTCSRLVAFSSQKILLLRTFCVKPLRLSLQHITKSQITH